MCNLVRYRPVFVASVTHCQRKPEDNLEFEIVCTLVSVSGCLSCDLACQMLHGVNDYQWV